MTLQNLVCVDETIITLTFNEPTMIPDEITIVVDGTLNKIKVNNKVAISYEDMELEMLSYVADYTFPPFTEKSGEFTGFTITSNKIESSKLKQGTQGVILENFKGTFKPAVATPAQSSAPAFDPNPYHTGTWKISSPRQSKLRVSE